MTSSHTPPRAPATPAGYAPPVAARSAAPAGDEPDTSALQRLESRLARLESGAPERDAGSGAAGPAAPTPSAASGSGKDVWDVVQILGGALVPVAIAAGGWFYSEATSRAQLQAAEAQQRRDSEIAVAEARVKQAALVKDFLEALTGGDSVKQRVAIRAVLIGLPQDGPQLVRELTRGGSATPPVAAFAGAALRDRCQALVEQLFAPVAEVRVRASADLLAGWGSSPVLLEELLPYAQAHLANTNGVYNTLGVLQDLPPALLAARRAQVTAFVDAAERAPGSGERIRSLGAAVRARLRQA